MGDDADHPIVALVEYTNDEKIVEYWSVPPYELPPIRRFAAANPMQAKKYVECVGKRIRPVISIDFSNV